MAQRRFDDFEGFPRGWFVVAFSDELPVGGTLQLHYFDRELVASVISNVLTNAIRYAGHALLIGIEEDGEQLIISVNDDGPGYPERMLERQQDYIQGLDASTGSTGLGLYFAARIAALHERNGVTGRIEISNGGALGGGLFRLYLP